MGVLFLSLICSQPSMELATSGVLNGIFTEKPIQQLFSGMPVASIMFTHVLVGTILARVKYV